LTNFDSIKHSDFLKAVASLPDRKNNDGQGRAAEAVARNFGVSVSTVYQTRAVIKNGQMDLFNALYNGDIPVKTAYKRLKKKENIMNINGFDELSYLKNSDSLLKEIKNIEKIINDAGFTSDVTPRFSVENNKISFDIRVSFPFPQTVTGGKTVK
jgi:hypothetical protein